LNHSKKARRIKMSWRNNEEKTVKVKDIEKIIESLELSNNYYGDRIVSLSYAYDEALEALCGLIGRKFVPYNEEYDEEEDEYYDEELEDE
jgi:hypothetical protein